MLLWVIIGRRNEDERHYEEIGQEAEAELQKEQIFWEAKIGCNVHDAQPQAHEASREPEKPRFLHAPSSTASE